MTQEERTRAAKLTHQAYCGMAQLPVFADLGSLRVTAARRLRRYRRLGFPVSVLTPGFCWEIEEPDECALIPDECGTLRLRLVCQECARATVYAGDRYCEACVDRMDREADAAWEEEAAWELPA